MTISNEDISALVEWEGWYYLLTEIQPDKIADVGAAEALQNLQDALRLFVQAVPELDVDIIDSTELNFD